MMEPWTVVLMGRGPAQVREVPYLGAVISQAVCLRNASGFFTWDYEVVDIVDRIALCVYRGLRRVNPLYVKRRQP